MSEKDSPPKRRLRRRVESSSSSRYAKHLFFSLPPPPPVAAICCQKKKERKRRREGGKIQRTTSGKGTEEDEKGGRILLRPYLPSRSGVKKTSSSPHLVSPSKLMAKLWPSKINSDVIWESERCVPDTKRRSQDRIVRITVRGIGAEIFLSHVSSPGKRRRDQELNRCTQDWEAQNFLLTVKQRLLLAAKIARHLSASLPSFLGEGKE